MIGLIGFRPESLGLIGFYPQAVEITNDLIGAATLATRIRAYASAELYTRTAAELLIQFPIMAKERVGVRCYATLAPTTKDFAQLSIRRQDD